VASQRVQLEWLRRVEAEYRSAALTQHLGLWLTQIAASPDLIRDALRIADDELAHAELSHAAYLAAGGAGAPRLDREHLALRRRGGDPLEHDVTRVAVEMFCLGETVAVPLFSHFRARATRPAARAALDRILRDEVRHRDFGWTLLDWLLESDAGGDLRRLVERELPAMLRRLEDNYGDPGRAADPGEAAPGGETSSAGPRSAGPRSAGPRSAGPPAAGPRSAGPPAAGPGDPADEDAAWGLAPAADYAAILERTVERDYRPRMARFGIDAAAAWRARRG